MIYYTIPVCAALTPYIKYFWVLESDAPYIHRSMADAGSEMVFHYKGCFNEILPDGTRTRSFMAGIQGPSRYTGRFETDKPFGIFGVYFQPGALPSLFGIAAEALVNQAPDLKDAGIKGLAHAAEQIFAAAHHEQRVSILTAFFERQLARHHAPCLPVTAAVRHIIQNRGQVRIESLATAFFISERQLERQFKKYTGFSPKLFARIVRFQQALRFYGLAAPSLTGIAHECGYYDQSHFIHDFKAFSGHHPKHFFAGGAEGTEWRD